MKIELIAIVSATLLSCGAAAAHKAPPAPCGAGSSPAAPVAAAPAAAPVRHALTSCTGEGEGSLLVHTAQKFLSDKELERALQRQLNGRLIDAKLNAALGEYTVLWEEQRAGKRIHRKLIVDARTGRVKREIGGRS